MAAGAIALLVALTPACSDGGRDDNSFRLDLDGEATVRSAGTTRTLDAGRHDVAVGDVVRMIDGSAVLELPGEREVWLREATAVSVADAPEIVEGDAVVVADGDDLRFHAGGVDATVQDGAARVTRGLSVTVAVYRGAAEVTSAGRTFEGGLPALRQLTIPATGLLPRAPVPLVYDDADPDPWDRRFLGDAIDLGRDLDGLSRGFTAQLGPRARVSASLLRDVLPPLADQDGFDDSFVEAQRESSPGEALIGAAIAIESSGSFLQRWIEVFSFRADGARWGLVALDQQVKRDALRGRIDDAVSRSPLLFAIGSLGAAPSPSTPAPTTPPSTTPPPDDGGGEEPPDDPDDPLPPVPPVPDPEDPPQEDDIFDVIDRLLSGDDPDVDEPEADIATEDSDGDSLIDDLLADEVVSGDALPTDLRP